MIYTLLMRENNNKYYQMIPEKLELRIKDIEKDPPRISGFRISYLKQIIYWVITKKEENGFSYLKMEFLRRQIPQAEQYIKFLRSERIIDRTKNYVPGIRSYGYKISDPYNSRLKFTLVTDPKLIRNIQQAPKRFAKGCQVQNRYIKLFTFDPEAEIFAKQNYSGGRYESAMISINMANNGEKYSTIDKAGHRFYSNITNMPKELRQFVTVKGKRLIANVDIKNSQPFFSLLILTDPAKVARFAKNHKFAMILKTLNVPENNDVDYFIELVTKGEFYDFLIPYFEERKLVNVAPTYKEKRDIVKKAVMKILFDRNRKKPSKCKQFFTEKFPTVANIFSIVRGRGDGSRFPILLQAIEAHIVLKVILPRINEEHPDIIAFSVHDSLLVTSCPEIVSQVMEEELLKFTGFTPQIKKERFSDSFQGLQRRSWKSQAPPPEEKEDVEERGRRKKAEREK